MKTLKLACIALLFVSFASAKTTLTRKTIESKVEKWTELQAKVFSKDANKRDAKALFSMYTSDFTLEQPNKVVYNKKELYEYRTKHMKRDNYDGLTQKKIVNTSVGGNVAFVEWVKVNPETNEQISDETFTTLIEFDGERIKHIKEYR